MTEAQDRAETRLFLAIDAAPENVAAQAAQIAALRPACVRLAAELDDTVVSALRESAFACGAAVVLSGPMDEALDRATAFGLDGIEVPASAKAVKRAVSKLDEDGIVGARMADRHGGMEAADAGASYVLLERGPEGLDLELVTWWAAMITAPLVVEGVRPEDIEAVIGLADFVIPDPALTAADVQAIAEALIV